LRLLPFCFSLPPFLPFFLLALLPAFGARCAFAGFAVAPSMAGRQKMVLGFRIRVRTAWRHCCLPGAAARSWSSMKTGVARCASACCWSPLRWRAVTRWTCVACARWRGAGSARAPRVGRRYRRNYHALTSSYATSWSGITRSWCALNPGGACALGFCVGHVGKMKPQHRAAFRSPLPSVFTFASARVSAEAGRWFTWSHGLYTACARAEVHASHASGTESGPSMMQGSRIQARAQRPSPRHITV
jgi:hypothetical protein